MGVTLRNSEVLCLLLLSCDSSMSVKEKPKYTHAHKHTYIHTQLRKYTNILEVTKT